MEHLLNPNVKEIEISGIRKFSNLVAQHDNVISLTIGQPDFSRRTMSKRLPKGNRRERHGVYSERGRT